jgi:DNA-binding NtrC family response regulator
MSKPSKYAVQHAQLAPKFTAFVAVSDNARAAVLARQLEIEGCRVESALDFDTAIRRLSNQRVDVAVVELRLAAKAGVNLVSYIRRRSPACQIVLLFDMDEVDRALDGIRQGAFFYLPSQTDAADVALVVRKALRNLTTQSNLRHFEFNLFQEMLGNTPAMRRILDKLQKVAPTDSTVLLLGESGTGKELMANTIHRLSARAETPFVAVNCAALPETLLESELFGHVKGAFTGAYADKQGLFKEADTGTVFLDEIGDMALITQAKVLRVLQNGEVRPVGSSVTERVNVRIIAATNRDLEEAVAQKLFREDLYYRLNVIQIRIPPLRERSDALPKLIAYFVRRYNQHHSKNVIGLDDAATAILQHYPFPGNVRELESIIAHAVIMADYELIRAGDLPDHVRSSKAAPLALPNLSGREMPTLREMEESLVRTALARFAGNQTEAARQLGISRSTLWRKLKEFGIDLDTRGPAKSNRSHGPVTSEKP